MATIIADLRYALRILRRSPVFSAAALFSLALGIGANTAIFTLMDQILLRKLPFLDWRKKPKSEDLKSAYFKSSRGPPNLQQKCSIHARRATATWNFEVSVGSGIGSAPRKIAHHADKD